MLLYLFVVFVLKIEIHQQWQTCDWCVPHRAGCWWRLTICVICPNEKCDKKCEGIYHKQHILKQGVKTVFFYSIRKRSNIVKSLVGTWYLHNLPSDQTGVTAFWKRHLVHHLHSCKNLYLYLLWWWRLGIQRHLLPVTLSPEITGHRLTIRWFFKTQPSIASLCLYVNSSIP